MGHTNTPCTGSEWRNLRRGAARSGRGLRHCRDKLQGIRAGSVLHMTLLLPSSKFTVYQTPEPHPIALQVSLSSCWLSLWNHAYIPDGTVTLNCGYPVPGIIATCNRIANWSKLILAMQCWRGHDVLSAALVPCFDLHTLHAHLTMCIGVHHGSGLHHPSVTHMSSHCQKLAIFCCHR